MNKNEKFVITINRELGSGGRTVGEKLAEKLGVQFYDKALIKALTEKYHLSVEEIENLKGRNHSWWAEFARSFMLAEKTSKTMYYDITPGEMPDVLTTEDMFDTEQHILKDIAEQESCVIAGRLGFAVFKDHPNHLSVLIQAPMEKRIERVMRKQLLSEADAKKVIQKVDKMRENYVNKYANTSRYDTRNYDLVISMNGHSIDEAVDLIMKYIK
ncbi:MAG: cytidylate kinase-like family protein [Bacteroidaceae bacterium]|jgi:cytidylate kinase|nr:cytidylate kinase-like family protein [Bacteroidaceae bacterium]MBR3618344.1 cytidylate kinase-like family protein [Bacteroidaceae bacterium]